MAGIDGSGGGIRVKAENASPLASAARSEARIRPLANRAGAAVEPVDRATAVVPAAQAAQVQRSASKVQQMLVKAAPNLSFSIDEDSGRTVIRVIDPETREVLRQIPAEEILRMDKNLDQMIERLKGLLIDRQS